MAIPTAYDFETKPFIEIECGNAHFANEILAKATKCYGMGSVSGSVVSWFPDRKLRRETVQSKLGDQALKITYRNLPAMPPGKRGCSFNKKGFFVCACTQSSALLVCFLV